MERESVERERVGARGRDTVAAWRGWARRLKTEIYALYLAARYPRTPWYARLCALCVFGYAFSPIDLIPYPIPVLGYLDDLILIPLGITLAVNMIPAPVLAECREKASTAMQSGKPVNWVAASVIIAVWLVLAALAVMLVLRLLVLH